MKLRSVSLPLSISAGYVLAFVAVAVLHKQISRGVADFVGLALYFPIGMWFLPLISRSSDQGLNATQLAILIGSLLVNALFMGWLLAAIVHRVRRRQSKGPP
jgi:ABC-type polysaccharide/polyol phosphate export permease